MNDHPEQPNRNTAPVAHSTFATFYSDKKKPTFYYLPLYIKWYPDLTPLDKDVWWMIKCLDNGDRHCWASDGWIADELGCHSANIQKSITKLRKLGLVDILSDSHTRCLAIPENLDEKLQWVIDDHTERTIDKRQIRAIKKRKEYESKLSKLTLKEWKKQID